MDQIDSEHELSDQAVGFLGGVFAARNTTEPTREHFRDRESCGILTRLAISSFSFTE